MKKTLLLLLLLASSFSIFAQAEIAIDKANEKGERTIGTKPIDITKFADKTSLLASVSAISLIHNGEKNISYFLDMKIIALGQIATPAKGKMLLKLSNDEVITLESEQGQEDKIGQIEKGLGLTTYRIIPMYSITPQQLELIASQGVKKIRIETTGEPIEKEYRKDKLGIAVKQQYALIKEHLSKDKKFSDDF